MTQTTLDLTGLKCPFPALKTRKALKSVKPGDILEVHCTDPLSVIDIPNLIRETGDKVEISERTEQRIVFLIEKAPLVARKRVASCASPSLEGGALIRNESCRRLRCVESVGSFEPSRGASNGISTSALAP